MTSLDCSDDKQCYCLQRQLSVQCPMMKVKIQQATYAVKKPHNTVQSMSATNVTANDTVNLFKHARRAMFLLGYDHYRHHRGRKTEQNSARLPNTVTLAEFIPFSQMWRFAQVSLRTAVKCAQKCKKLSTFFMNLLEVRTTAITERPSNWFGTNAPELTTTYTCSSPDIPC